MEGRISAATETRWYESKFTILVLFYISLAAVAYLIQGQVFILHMMSLTAHNVIIAVGFVIILGYTRQFSLGQVSFYGIGAYVVANLTRHFGLDYFWALALGGLVAGLFSVLIAIPGTRFKGPWLALITFSFAEIARVLFQRLKSITGGNEGFFNIPKPVIGPLTIDTELEFFLFFLLLALGSVYLAFRIRYSPLGRFYMSLGDNDIISSSIGINVFFQKVVAFFIGSLIAGVAGGLYAGYAGYLSPDLFGLKHTLFYLTALVLGGLGSLQGVVVATIGLTLIHNFTRALHPWDLVLYGLIIMVCINLFPAGLGKLMTDLMTWIHGSRVRSQK
jgi:branched-chain amino acid transport system permease protein